MTQIREARRRRAWWVPLRLREAGEEPQRSRRRRVVAAMVVLAGYLLFCHGCHGDEDNELFAVIRQQAAAFRE